MSDSQTPDVQAETDEPADIQVTGKGRRLHGVSPLFLFLEAAKKIILPLILGAVGTQGMIFEDRIMIGVAVVLSITAAVQFWFYHYWLESDRLVVKEGILFKSLRQIPYARIQNVNVERNLMHRLFKVATLQLESASGAKPEAVIRVIADAEVQHIKDTIKAKTAEEDAENETAAEVNAGAQAPDFAMSARDVATFGFISHRALVPLGVVFSVLSQNDHYRDRFLSLMQHQVGALDVSSWGWPEWLLYGGVSALFALLCIWVVSIGLAFLKLHGFTLNRARKQIHASMGLLTNITAHIPLKRIQLIRIKSTPLHRFFRRVAIKIETAGGVTEESGISMSWLAPLIAPEQGQRLLAKIQPEVDWGNIQWQRLAPRSWRRMFKRWLLVLGVAMLPLWYFQPLWSLGLLLLVPVAYWHSKQYVKRAGYAHNEQIIAFRSGVWFHHMAIVKINKVQNISMSQSPFDRRNVMACLAVDTAGSNPVAQHINIHYVDEADITHMYHKLAAQVSASRFVW